MREGKDLHSELTTLTFNIPLSAVKDPFPPKPDISYRDVQKILDFGLSYGMSAFKASDTLGITKEAAQEIIDNFFKAVPKVDKFLKELGELGKQRGWIRSGPVFGRIRWFPKWEQTKDRANPDRFKILGEIERASKNAPIQATNANIIKLALIRVQDEIDNNNWPVTILLSVYDELVTECREDKAEEWCKKLEQLMIEAAQTVIKTVPIKADCKISSFWTK